MKIEYVPKKFRAESIRTIETANAIIAEYDAQGYSLTLRQLYYQFVSRDLIANSLKEYKNLGSLINDGRLAGLIDWDAIEDRTRNLHSLSHWESAPEIVRSCAKQFRLDKWDSQPCRVEVWIEKEALAGVFQRICDELDVPMFACRGYTSQSEMWAAGQRLERIKDRGQEPIVLHFGDHDPSGIDMTRDIRERLALFMGGVELQRLALNREQVDKYSPPPNPAKATDARFNGYLAEFGEKSWELDALEPKLLSGLVRRFVEGVRDEGRWDEALDREETTKEQLADVADKRETIVEGL